MDDRFTSVVIDEPELGLSPILQRRLADIIIRGHNKAALFPHRPNIALSTHSHIFLDKLTPENNYVVSKFGNIISARRCSGFADLNEILFRLLGNDLNELFLPDAVIFVEGETDKLFLEKVISLHLPGIKIVVQQCGGDIAKRLSYWSEMVGDMQLSPYRSRTFVIYDSVKQAGIERSCDRAGLPASSRIEWQANGIEFVYPRAILSEIYRSSVESTNELQIDGDKVSKGEISYRKMDLCRMVCDRMTIKTALSEELTEKLLSALRASLT